LVKRFFLLSLRLDADSTFWSKIHTVQFLEEENIFSFDSSLSEQIFFPKLHHSENDVVQTREKGRGLIDLSTAWRNTWIHRDGI
jgi:hypothetical protein